MVDFELDLSDGIGVSGSRSEVKVSEERLDNELRELLQAALSEGSIEYLLSEQSISSDEVFDHLRPRLLLDQATREEVAEVAWEADDLRRRKPETPAEDREWTPWLLAGTFFAASILIGTIAVALAALASLFFPISISGSAPVIATVATFLGVLLTILVPRREQRLRLEGKHWQLESQAARKKRERLIEGTVLTELRAWINEISSPAFSSRLTPTDTGGLRDLFDSKYEVPVSATIELKRTLDALKAGSVGIAGPRGVGKSTLIQAACDSRLPEVVDNPQQARPLGLSVSAPTRYGGQEFVRFLFMELCLKLCGGESRLRFKRQRRYQRANAWWRIFAALLSGALLASGMYVLVSGQPERLLPLVTSAVGGAIAIGVLGGTASLLGFRPVPSADGLADIAEESLESLRYTETLTEEYVGQFSAKLATLTDKRGRSRAAQPWSFPEIVANYRSFVSEITRDRPLIIGIDELDKMANAEEARGFLNEMKSLFDQSRVYYLVSISEEALSDFERRGQPMRDVFDSVFNDVLQIDFLSRSESEALLRRRAIGIPTPWPSLFHSLAGGLPRESIRVARRAVRIAAAGKDDLGSVTLALIAEGSSAHQHAAAVMAQGEVADDGTQPVLGWLRNLPDLAVALKHPDPERRIEWGISMLQRKLDIEGVIKEIRQWGDGRRPGRAGEMERLVMELAAGWFHGLNCLEFFSDLSEARFEEASAVGPDGMGTIDLLAASRQDLARSPSLAWETLNAFRHQMNLDPVEYPALPNRSVSSSSGSV